MLHPFSHVHIWEFFCTLAWLIVNTKRSSKVLKPKIVVLEYKVSLAEMCVFGFLLSSKNKSLMGVVEQPLIFPVCVSFRGRLKEKCLLNMHHSIVSLHQKDWFIKNIVNSCTTFRKVKLWKRIINDWLLPVLYHIPSKQT